MCIDNPIYGRKRRNYVDIKVSKYLWRRKQQGTLCRYRRCHGWGRAMANQTLFPDRGKVPWCRMMYHCDGVKVYDNIKSCVTWWWWVWWCMCMMVMVMVIVIIVMVIVIIVMVMEMEEYGDDYSLYCHSLIQWIVFYLTWCVLMEIVASNVFIWVTLWSYANEWSFLVVIPSASPSYSTLLEHVFISKGVK